MSKKKLIVERPAREGNQKVKDANEICQILLADIARAQVDYAKEPNTSALKIDAFRRVEERINFALEIGAITSSARVFFMSSLCNGMKMPSSGG